MSVGIISLDWTALNSITDARRKKPRQRKRPELLNESGPELAGTILISQEEGGGIRSRAARGIMIGLDLQRIIIREMLKEIARYLEPYRPH